MMRTRTTTTKTATTTMKLAFIVPALLHTMVIIMIICYLLNYVYDLEQLEIFGGWAVVVLEYSYNVRIV